MTMKSRIIGWCLYDFAASVLMVNGGVYFVRWLVLERGQSISKINFVVSGIALFVLVTASSIGRLVDRIGDPTKILRACAIAMGVAAILISVVSRSASTAWLQAFLAICLFAVLYVCNQWGLIAYNSILPTLENPERVSGLGTAFNWLGALTGLLVTYPFVAKAGPDMGGSAEAFLPAALLYTLFAATAFILLGTPQNLQPNDAVRKSTSKETGRSVKKGAFWPALFALLFFSDAVLTIQLNAATYVNQIFGIRGDQVALSFVVLFFGIAAGGLGYAFVGPKTRSHLVFKWSLLFLAGNISFLAFATDSRAVPALFLLSGVAVGLSYSSIRAVFAERNLGRVSGSEFGLYTAVERAGSILGPVVWATTISVAKTAGTTAPPRIAMASMAVLVMLGFVALAVGTFPPPAKSAHDLPGRDVQQGEVE